MNGDLKKLITATLKRYGDQAAEHFGVKQTTLNSYLKKGRYPLAFIEKVLASSGIAAGQVSASPVDAPPTPEPEPTPVPPPQPEMAGVFNGREDAFAAAVVATSRRVEEVVKYIQGTVDVYLKLFAQKIAALESQMVALRNAQLRAAGMPNLVRPAQGVPVEQTFTTNPNTGVRNPLDTGIAPTKEMVDAQANMTIIEGVPVPGAELARPAEYIPDQPSFGFGWNAPRQRK